MASAASIAWHLARASFLLDFRDRRKLEAYQDRRLRHFLERVLPRAPRYRTFQPHSLVDLPISDKATMMDDFFGHNTRGVPLDQAVATATTAESSRDFSATLGDLTVGLSSGTSGHRGVFLVSPSERRCWAGTILARALPAALLRRLIQPWKPPIRIAFFLRANSNLYSTLSSRRVDFTFFDLLRGARPALEKLDRHPPDVLVGPPALLKELASYVSSGSLRIQPQHIVSVADVLEPGDDVAIREAFGSTTTHQIYQATEGFLGYTCERGVLHLNEAFVHFEPEWLDDTRTRFRPLLTDFSRHTQLIVRYRLNDILRITDIPCPCGRAERSIAAIDGRADEVLWLRSADSNRAIAIYPDAIRQAMLLATAAISNYQITQVGEQLHIGLETTVKECEIKPLITAELQKVWQRTQVVAPELSFVPWRPPQLDAKRRRVRVQHPPADLSCGF